MKSNSPFSPQLSPLATIRKVATAAHNASNDDNHGPWAAHELFNNSNESNDKMGGSGRLML